MQGYALIASADPARSELYAAVVSEEGLEPVVAHDGDVARSILRSRGVPAMTVAELSLARADGFTLLGEVRHMQPGLGPPAVVVSAIPHFRETAWELREALGIADVLSTTQLEASLRASVHRAMEGAASAHRSTMLPEEIPGPDENTRLAIIAALGLVDEAPPDASLQLLVEQTARAFGVPIALVSIILEDRQWFMAHYGLSGHILEARGTPRDIAFCRHVVEGDSPEPLIVPDATVHPVFATNPLVTSGAVRSYAGAPLVTSDGHILGTLCILDSKPSGIGAEQVERLVALASHVAHRLESRRASR